MAFKGGVVLGTVSLNATLAGTTAIGATSNTGTIAIGNTNSGAVSIDCGVAGITVGTTANAHTSTFGSTNGASVTTVQSGSGALSLTSTNGTWTGNSGTGTIGLSTDATNTTVNLASGAGNKLVQLGSTSGASSLALRTGTADFSLASATGNIMVALDTGEITYPLQSAFLATLSANAVDVTGDGTAYTIINDTEVYDQNADYNNATGVFTAPVTGRYLFSTSATLSGLLNTHTACSFVLITSNRNYRLATNSPWAESTNAGVTTVGGSSFVDMDAADTASVVVTVSNGTKVVDILGAAPLTFFGGNLIC